MPGDSGGDETGGTDDAGETGGTGGTMGVVDGSDDDSDSDGDETTDTGEETTGDTGEETTGDTGEETTGDTGEQCELQTEDHCLACNDACELDTQCTPIGCLGLEPVGFDAPFAGIGGHPNRLWGFPVEIDGDAWLVELAFHAVGNGGDVQMALYTDDGGVPSELIVASEVLSGFGAGEHLLPVEGVALEAGTYWLMARNETPSQIGLNFDPDVLPSFPISGVFIDFDAPLPETLVGVETFNGYEINLFANVLQ